MNKFVAIPSPPSNGDEGRNASPCVPATNFNDPDNYEDATEVYGDFDE